MNSESPFRIATVALFALTVLIVGYHRWQAAQSGERISRRDEGLLLAVTLRLAGLALWVGTVLYLVDPSMMAWARLPVPDWLRWTGAGVGVLFVGLISWTLHNLGKNLTDTVMTREEATLVTTGPYRVVRHPFYVSVGLLIVAIMLLTANAFIGASGLFVILLLVVRTTKEEEKLIEKFGESYRAYMATTGRFGPKFWRRA